jgi:hypothetical protein
MKEEVEIKGMMKALSSSHDTHLLPIDLREVIKEAATDL